MITIKVSLCHLALLLVLVVSVSGRSLPIPNIIISSDGRKNNLVSDGMNTYNNDYFYYENQTSLLLLPSSREFGESMNTHECEQMYGFLPCSSNMYGHLFLVVVYEYLLFHGESYVAEGGEMIFKILGPGVFGASAFHILGALPESLLLLVSGLLSTKEKAQENVMNGVGVVAGSSILLLTLVWGTCVIVGRHNFSNPSISNILSGNNNSIVSTILSLDFKRLGALLTGAGITTDSETSCLARIMVFSVIPFSIVEISNIINTWQRIAILIALFVSLVLLLMYFIYQVFQPWLQYRRLEYMKHAHLMSVILQHVQKRALGRLLTDDGAPNVDAIRRLLFDEVNESRDGFVSASEEKGLSSEIKFKAHTEANKEQAITNVMEDFDQDGDREFENGLINLVNTTNPASNNSSDETEDDIYQKTWKETEKLMEEGNKRVIYSLAKAWAKAIAYLMIGIIMLSILAEPLIDSVQSFSQSTGVPSFFISFILVPLATNARVATSAISTASRQTPRTNSLTFSELYGGVFANNIVGFSVLLSLIYFREMTWELSTEILVVLLVCSAIGIVASFRSKFALWTAILAYALYPLSLLFIYLFNHVHRYP